MNRPTTSRAIPAALVLLLFTSLAPAATGDNLEALDYAFRFGSAIEPDPKDQAMAQYLAVVDYVAVGAFAEAAAAADRIRDWRRGTSYADIAAMLAREGRDEDARSFIEKAEGVRQVTEGWQGARIHAHIARALAELGDVEGTRRIMVPLGSADRVYSARGVATVAEALAARGDYDEAMTALAGLERDDDIYDTWWRSAGYVAVARREHFTTEQRLRALELARSAADRISGWKRAEALLNVAAEYTALGDEKRAVECLEAADELAAALPKTMTARPLMLSALAGSWTALGRREHALELLAPAEEGISEALSIDQPRMLAAVAGGYHEAGNETEALRLYGEALAGTEALVNARPRALAAADVCRSMGRSGYPLDEATKARLNGLLSGLGDPW